MSGGEGGGSSDSEKGGYAGGDGGTGGGDGDNASCAERAPTPTRLPERQTWPPRTRSAIDERTAWHASARVRVNGLDFALRELRDSACSECRAGDADGASDRNVDSGDCGARDRSNSAFHDDDGGGVGSSGDGEPAHGAVSLDALTARVASECGYAPHTVKLIHNGRVLRTHNDLVSSLEHACIRRTGAVDVGRPALGSGEHDIDNDGDTNYDRDSSNDRHDIVLVLKAIGSSASALEVATHTRPDPLLRPFDIDAGGAADDGRHVGSGRRDLSTRASPPRRKYEARPARTSTATNALAASPMSYGFGEARVLADEFPADHDRARAVLERLIAEPGVQHVMRTRRWRVGALCEMRPDGRVGVDPVCVLGYNSNAGEAIHLRLRTDDLRGFRRYDTVRRVLMHELAHNAYSEHSTQFYELMRAITREADANDWRRQEGRRVGSGGGGDVGAGANVVERLGSARHAASVPGASAPVEGAMAPAQAPSPPPEQQRATRENSKQEERQRQQSRQAPAEWQWQQPRQERGLGGRQSPERRGPPAASLSGSSSPPGADDDSTNGASPDGWSHVHARYVADAALLRGTAEERLRAMRAALDWLFGTQSRDDAIRAVRTLHVYLDNARTAVEQQWPSLRYRRIRMANAAFAARIGRYPAAVDVLRAVGFVDERDAVRNNGGSGGGGLGGEGHEAVSEAYLVLHRSDAGLLWLAQSVLDEFGAACGA